MSDTKISRWGGALFDALHWRTLREPLVPVFAILLLLASLVPWFAFRPLFSDFSAQLAWRPWRAELRRAHPEVDQVGGRPPERVTLGELIGYVVFTLTEVALRALSSRLGSA